VKIILITRVSLRAEGQLSPYRVKSMLDILFFSC
jgi:hypothetical protein